MTEARSTILVVEDEPEIRRFLRSSLGADGYRVVEAESGSRGATDAGTHKPDLAIVDLGLPDLDGVEVIRRIRSWSGMPIVVLSARIQERSESTRIGIGDHSRMRRITSTPSKSGRPRSTMARSGLCMPASSVPRRPLGDSTTR